MEEVNVLAELQAVTDLSRKEGESGQSYVDRLARKANDLSEDDWESLETATQLWVNAAIEAISRKEAIPLPAGLAADEVEEEEVVESKKKAVAKKTAPAVKASKEPAKKVAAKAAKKAASPGPKGKFGVDAVIKVLAKENPYRESAKAHSVFAKYRDGMTVAEAVEAGVGRAHIRWDASHGHIRLQ